MCVARAPPASAAPRAFREHTTNCSLTTSRRAPIHQQTTPATHPQQHPMASKVLGPPVALPGPAQPHHNGVHHQQHEANGGSNLKMAASLNQSMESIHTTHGDSDEVRHRRTTAAKLRRRRQLARVGESTKSLLLTRPIDTS